ncbi:hypothetical protein GGI16_002430 [Coemansia sp. S142-1]|nr:hypothetical protein GGI16_002430 [Coemansia sp. S142-1]
MENPFRRHSTMVSQPGPASYSNGAPYRHPEPLNSLFELTPERMRMLNSRNNYRCLAPHRTINTYGAASSIDRYSSLTAGLGSSENVMSTWRSPQPVGLGEVSGAGATSSLANNAVTNASSANTTSKADEPLSHITSAVVYMSATEINTQPVDVNNPVTSASSTSIAAEANAHPVNAKSRHFAIPSMQAKRKCDGVDGVDGVYKKRGVGLNSDNIGTAINVICVSPTPREYALIRARPRPKGQAPTLAARRAHRRSPHVPGSGYRPAPRLSPEHVAVLRAMRFSSAVVGSHPAGQGEIEDGIAHAAAQQQMPDTFGMDVEARGQDTFVDNAPVVYGGMHAPASQPVNITFGMDVDAPAQHAVAELHPAGQGAVVGDVDVPPQHVGTGIGLDPIDQGANTSGLAQAPAPQPVNNTFGMDVDATEQHPVAEVNPVGRDITRPFADWVVARSARYATLRAYLRKMRQLDRAAPYHVPTREQRRRLLRKWADVNNAANAAAQQRPQSALGADTVAPTQHAAIDSEAVVGTNSAGQGAIEGDIDHATTQQQMGPGVASTDSLARATDGGHENGEGEDDELTSHYWIEQRYNNHGPPDSQYAVTAERMFRVLLNERLVDVMDNSDHVNKLRELVEILDYDIVREYRSRHNEDKGDYIDLPDEPVDEYGHEAPAFENTPGADVDEYDPVAPEYENDRGADVGEYDPFAPAYENAPGAHGDEYDPVAPEYDNAPGADVDEYDPFDPAY